MCAQGRNTTAVYISMYVFYYMEYTVAIFAVIYKQSTYVAASYNQCFTLQKTPAINDLILPFGFVAIFWYMIT